MKLKQIIGCIVAITGTAVVISATLSLTQQQSLKERNEAILQSKNLPTEAGIHITSISSLAIDNTPLKQDVVDNKEFIKIGYIKRSEPRATELLNYKNIAEEQFQKFDGNYLPYSTHLRHSSSDLQMSYSFKGVPEKDIFYLIGVAPGGAFDKNKGWSGAVEFFIAKDLGTCAYTEDNLTDLPGGVEVVKELVRHDINEKITLVNVRGAPKTGFLYHIQWFDNKFIRQLECANKKYSLVTTNVVIELAKRIDAYNS